MNSSSIRSAVFKVSSLAFLLHSPFLAGASSWVVKDPFDFKVFVENKGQFSDPENRLSSTIAFGTSTGGATWLFGRHGFYIVRYVPAEDEQEKKLHEIVPNQTSEEHDRYEEEERKLVPVYEEFTWLNASRAVQLVAEDSATGYFCYQDPGSEAMPRTIRAYGFKKLKYLNIYPGIDAEFYFPADSSGVKYSLVLHQGANLSTVKFQYSQATESRIGSSGDLSISSPIGTITEHAPLAFSPDGSEGIPCSFRYIRSEKCFGFWSRKNNDMIIDPWIQVPTFSSGSNAYDVDFDDSGHVYVMGGSGPPFFVSKYDSSGSILWTYGLPFSNNYCGDFAVDRSSGMVYITEGFTGGNPASIYKLSPGASLIAQYFGTSQMNELWRIAYNSCSRQGVIAAGGIFGNNQACALDTTLSNIVPVNVLNVTTALHDMGCLAIDNYGYCYFYVNKSAFGTVTPHDNHIIKMDLPALSTIVYSVASGYFFTEASSVLYNGNPGSYSNAYNGLCISGQTLFSWDGYTLKKWDALTGANLLSNPVNTAIDPSEHYWGGVSSDPCLNVFVGDNDSIAMYDSTLTRIFVMPAPDPVYDVMVGMNGNLYACGEGFVMATQVPAGSCTFSTSPLNVQVLGNFCDTFSTVNVVVTGGSPPYNITWSTNPPQSGSTAYFVTPGTYTVTVTDTSSCGNFSTTTPFTVQPGTFPQHTFAVTDPCVGMSNGSIAVTASGGDSANYIYSWNTTPPQFGQTLQGLAPGTYILTVADSVCNKTYPVVLTSIGDTLADPASVNVFTPNGDGFNDIFFPVPFPGNTAGVTSGYRLAIFNRWGMKLFETKDPAGGWDGMISGNTHYSSGVYYYILEYQSPCYSGGAAVQRAGFVHLVGE